MLTDAQMSPWIDKTINALDMDFPDESINIIIASHTIHHFANPYKFFMECIRVLKRNGLVLINEINTSLIMRIILRCMRHEGWSYDVNIFDSDTIVNDPNDIWSANCAVPEILFRDKDLFMQNMSRYNKEAHKQEYLDIIHKQLCECTIFPLSGGVIAKTSVPQLPYSILKFFDALDSFLVNIAPTIFAMGMRVVLQKKELKD